MADTTAEDVLEGLERLLAGVAVLGSPPPVAVFRGPDEAGMAQRDADRIFTAWPVSDKRTDQRSGGSCYRVLQASVGIQYHRNKLTRRRMLADAVLFEDALRHASAGLAALATPVAGVKWVRLIDGPRFDFQSAQDVTKAMTAFVVEAEYHTATG